MPHAQFQFCIDACNVCAVDCDRCAMSCLAQADAARLAHCIVLTMDCAQVCRLAAGMMARHSACAEAVCDACAQACEICCRECATHAGEHCQQCVQACLHCAAECRRMIAALRHGAHDEPTGGAYAG